MFKILKVSFTAYLFLFLLPLSFGQGQPTLGFDNERIKAYTLILALKFEEAKELTADNNPTSLYLQSLSESLQLVISEDDSEYDQYIDLQGDRIDKIKDIKRPSALNGFLRAEMNIHSAFVNLKFGHEFKAAWQIKRAYKIASANKIDFPESPYHNKTLGLLHVLIGSVPQKYSWIISLFGMEGNINDGLVELSKVSDSSNIFSREAKLIQSLIYSYLLGRPERGIQMFGNMYQTDSTNELMAYLNILLLSKAQRSAEALEILETFPANEVKIDLMNYARGEAYLQKGDLSRARKAYETFISDYKGKSNIKDALYKIFLTSYLNDELDKETLRNRAFQYDEEVTEADKYAARRLKSKQDPNRLILRIRLLVDGGFYNEAQILVEENSAKQFDNDKDRAEFEYRKARLEHSQKHLEKAIIFYKNTISLSSKKEWYFGPNSCLLLGNIYKSQNKNQEAREYFNKVFEFSGYDYERSIKNKAKQALENLD